MRAVFPWVGLVTAVIAVVLLTIGRVFLGLYLLVLALVLTAGIIWERWGYRKITADIPGGPDWRETGERFVDPASGRAVSVYFNARSGERAYVAAK